MSAALTAPAPRRAAARRRARARSSGLPTTCRPSRSRACAAPTRSARRARGQTRKSGEPYITHPVAVAGILAELGMDAETLIAAILHDTLEDTPADREQITAEFGADRRRAGRRRHQARQGALPQPPGSRRRKLPQDAAGDGARPARDPDQARRPPAQHAHARRDGRRVAPPHRARDAGHLRADRAAAGHEPRSSPSCRTSASARCIRIATASSRRASARVLGNRREAMARIEARARRAARRRKASRTA